MLVNSGFAGGCVARQRPELQKRVRICCAVAFCSVLVRNSQQLTWYSMNCRRSTCRERMGNVQSGVKPATQDGQYFAGPARAGAPRKWGNLPEAGNQPIVIALYRELTRQ